MRQTFIVLLILLCSAALLSFGFLILSAPDTRLVLSQFDATLSEPIPEESQAAPRSIEAGSYQLQDGIVSLMIARPAEVQNAYAGTTTLSTGALTLTQSPLGHWNGYGTFTIDMASMFFLHGDDDFDLHSSDFFATNSYPHATLSLMKMIQQGDSSVFTLEGRLTLRNETHNVTIPSATIYLRDDSLVLETDFTFDRTQWGMTHASPSFSGTQGHTMLNDMVSMNLLATFPLK